MKTILITLTAAGVLALGAPAYASEELANKNGCTEKCHSIDKKKKGPAFKKTAEKYKGKADAEATIISNFKKEHDEVKVSDGDLKTLTKWILTL